MLFGISPGQLSVIERGLQFPKAAIAMRIMAATMAMGPEEVNAIDLLEAWHRKYPQESIAQRAAGRAAVTVFRNAATEKSIGKTKG